MAAAAAAAPIDIRTHGAHSWLLLPL